MRRFRAILPKLNHTDLRRGSSLDSSSYWNCRNVNLFNFSKNNNVTFKDIKNNNLLPFLSLPGTQCLSHQFASYSTMEPGYKASLLGKVENNEKLNHRAKIKFLVLSDVKIRANQLRKEFLAANSLHSTIHQTHHDEIIMSDLLEKWTEQEILLSQTYSKAIKYVARTREKDAAHKAGLLLHEMIERMGAPHTNFNPEGGGGTRSDEKELGEMRKMVIDDKKSKSLKLSLPNVYDNPFSPPTKRDFHNVLHSWASSKARRKGLEAEFLLFRMTELARWFPDLFYTLPDSKTFSLVVKCFSGSTYSLALAKIIKINKIHDQFAKHRVDGIVKDDPFLLMHSLKSIKNYRNKNERLVLNEWFNQLHVFVLDPSNTGYFSEPALSISNSISTGEISADDCQSDNEGNLKQINLTAIYTSIIRDYARLRGDMHAASKARDVLEKMHDVNNYHLQSKAEGLQSLANVCIQVNTYNLVIGAYANSKGNENVEAALELLQRMVDSWAKGDNKSAIPHPDETSFSHCINALSNTNDETTAIKESHRLIKIFESIYNGSNSTFSPTAQVYNSCLDLYCEKLANKQELMSTCSKMVKRMKHLSFEFPDVEPDVKTSSLLLKACSLVDGHALAKIEALETAVQIFNELVGKESKGAIQKLTTNDRCYLYMMRCILNLVSDAEEIQSKNLDLFLEACNKGMVSVNVLKAFEKSVTREVFIKVAGNGRLPEKWTSNVTSVKPTYTDGTTGGPGKNARRKGKGSSKWTNKNQRQVQLSNPKKFTNARNIN